MTKIQIIYFISVLYFSLVCGIALKLYLKAIYGTKLLYVAILPISIFVLSVIASVQCLFSKELCMKEKLCNVLIIFKYTIAGFPVLASTIGIHIIDTLSFNPINIIVVMKTMLEDFKNNISCDFASL